ncbi:MAG: GNAT family N-acetyltransferase [Thermoleophilaceae bacterium]|nr:GNAT family N-acetyltransferase [Thermoleophilaceae bacterium]
MAIRPATGDDVESIRLLVERAYSRWVPRIGLRPAPMDADYAALVEEGDVFVLADPGVVGVIVLRPAEGEALMVENIAVDPDRQGRGLGPTLLEFAEAQARGRGVCELRLYTHRDMTENIELYERLGWTEYDRVASEGFARVFLRKHLTALRAGD